MEYNHGQRRASEGGGESVRGESAGRSRRSAASTITAGELALVCARYNVGEITRVERLRRGSGSAPKVVLETSTGRYILKRLAPARSDPRRVGFGHELVLYLVSSGFTAPGLVGTREGNNSMLQMRGQTYEMYRYIEGREDSKSVVDAARAGWALARLHRALEGFEPRSGWTPTVGTYHDSEHVTTALARIPKRFDDPDRREVVLGLVEQYRRAAVEAKGTEGSWRMGPYIHGDWHPGNLLYGPEEVGGADSWRKWTPERDAGGVVCVLDFDSARRGMRVIDVANGALQFAMGRGRGAKDGSPRDGSGTSERRAGGMGGRKPTELDVDRYRAFIDGYHFGIGGSMAVGERTAVPWLMVQALIGEAALPIAITGRFGKVDPMGLLRVVRRKVEWIAGNAGELTRDR